MMRSLCIMTGRIRRLAVARLVLIFEGQVVERLGGLLLEDRLKLNVPIGVPGVTVKYC